MPPGHQLQPISTTCTHVAKQTMWLTLAAAVALAIENLITPSKYHCDIYIVDPAQNQL